MSIRHEEGKCALSEGVLAEIDAKGGDTLARQAYLVLREGIILGRYQEGERLAEQRLAQELAIPRFHCVKPFPNLRWKVLSRLFRDGVRS